MQESPTPDPRSTAQQIADIDSQLEMLAYVPWGIHTREREGQLRGQRERLVSQRDQVA